MKKTPFIVVVIVAAIAAGVLFSGYVSPPTIETEKVPAEAPTTPTEEVTTEEARRVLEDIYQGFMSVERGDWVEYKHTANGNTTIMKAIYAGREVFDGETYTGFETVGFPTEGMEMEMEIIAVQVWYSPTASMFVFKTTEGVFKGIGIKQEREIYAETPDFFKPENIPENWEAFTFITETGKTVRGIKFKNPAGEEIWLSSEVPFGIVKYIAENFVSELRDFGKGAELKITIEEVRTAKSFGEFFD